MLLRIRGIIAPLLFALLDFKAKNPPDETSHPTGRGSRLLPKSPARATIIRAMVPSASRRTNHGRPATNNDRRRAINHRGGRRTVNTIARWSGWRAGGRGAGITRVALRMAVGVRDDESGNGNAGEHGANRDPFAIARPGRPNSRAGERENHCSSQNHLFHH